MIKEAIIKLSKKENLIYTEAEEVMNEIMEGKASDVQKSAYLTALSMKGETIDEITASAAGMRAHCIKLLHDMDVLEIVGTGGDGANSFNISTTSSLVIAAAGIPVAKHGNRAASSKSGAADVLEALGVKIDVAPERSTQLLKDIQICFLFAQNYHIAMKYVTYALAATLSGSILGAVIGEKLLPWIIINAYKMMYTGLGDVYTPLEIEYSVMAGGLAVGVVVLAVLSACYKELREKPAQLMRPVAPKEGKRILLERIPFIWKRLSFIWKATMRNLFRYKKRFFMTIFGIGGCMALLLLGFGIKDSISAISEKQYGEIITYDFSITHKDGISETKKEDLIQYAKKQEHMTDLIEVSESAVTIRANGKKQDATMIQPMSKKDLNGYISLQDRKSKTKYHLEDDGISLTEKEASLLGVKKGDSIKIQRSGDKQITAKISQITENYMQHKVYMTPKLYEKLYHKKAQTTGIYCIEKNISKKKMQENGKQILARDEASTLHFCADDEKTMSDMVNNLNIVVVVLIVSAGLLAFVVLYNLNNINISERRMELATIKVLGFYDGEVGAYVYRENILLTILGTIAGIILGIILHKYVIFTTEVDLIMFGRQIYVQSYIYSILLTIAFSILVNAFVYFQLKKIDMVESLKSTE